MILSIIKSIELINPDMKTMLNICEQWRHKQHNQNVFAAITASAYCWDLHYLKAFVMLSFNVLLNLAQHFISSNDIGWAKGQGSSPALFCCGYCLSNRVILVGLVDSTVTYQKKRSSD